MPTATHKQPSRLARARRARRRGWRVPRHRAHDARDLRPSGAQTVRARPASLSRPTPRPRHFSRLGRFVALTPPRPPLSPAPARRCSPTRTPPSRRPRTGTAGARCPTRTPPSRPRRAPTVPARPPTVATRRSDRRAAFDNYARADADRIPSGCVVLALADLRAFDDDVDHELVGRLVAAETRADPAGVSFERFVTIADVVEARRAVPGGLGRADAGAMAPPAPEYLRSEPLRALFLARADEHQLLSASAWIQLARDARLVDDEDEEDDDEDKAARASRASNASKASKASESKASSRATLPAGSLTAAGASVIFARARGPSAERDAALAFSPDFLAALGWAAGRAGPPSARRRRPRCRRRPRPFRSRRLCRRSQPQILARASATWTSSTRPSSTICWRSATAASDLATRRSRRDGDVVVFVRRVSRDATFARRPARGILLARIRVDSDSPRGVSMRGSGPSRVRSGGRARGALGRGGRVRSPRPQRRRDFPRVETRVARPRTRKPHPRPRARGRVDPRGLRATPPRRAATRRAASRETTKTTKAEETSPFPRDRDGSRSSRAAIRLPVPVAREATRDDVDALRRVFERFCAARDEAGIDAPAHPTMMDASRWDLFARRAALFDAGFEVGAERVAFARACPPGNFRVGFDGFLVALGFVAAQRASTPRASRSSRSARGRPWGLPARPPSSPGGKEKRRPTRRARARARTTTPPRDRPRGLPFDLPRGLPFGLPFSLLFALPLGLVRPPRRP